MPGSRTRVCVVTGGHWAAVMGGAQYQAKCLVDEMLVDGSFDVFYLARDIDPGFEPEGYEIRQIAKPNFLTRKSFLFDAPFLLHQLKAIDPDVVYQRGLQPYTGIIAHYCRRKNKPFVFQIAHDFDVSHDGWERRHRRPVIKRLEMTVSRYGLEHATHIIAQTRTQADLLSANYRKQASGVVRNFHPFPHDPIEKPSEPVQVVWIANFKPFKRPEAFVDLAEKMQVLKDVRFVMIGRPGASSLYKGLHERIAAAPNISYMGELPLAKVNEVLSESHIFVNTSTAEGFPNTFIQAWLRRAVVVSLDVDTDGVLKRNQAGYLAGNAGQLERIVRRLVAEEDEREAMAARSDAYCREMHSSSNARFLLDLFRERPSIGEKPCFHC